MAGIRLSRNDLYEVWSSLGDLEGVKTQLLALINGYQPVNDVPPQLLSAYQSLKVTMDKLSGISDKLEQQVAGVYPAIPRRDSTRP